jgi:hypothetical protein
MRINSYGRTAMVSNTNSIKPIRKVHNTQLLSVMELQEMTRNDSSSLIQNSESGDNKRRYNQIDFSVLLDAIIKSGDLKQ